MSPPQEYSRHARGGPWVRFRRPVVAGCEWVLRHAAPDLGWFTTRARQRGSQEVLGTDVEVAVLFAQLRKVVQTPGLRTRDLLLRRSELHLSSALKSWGERPTLWRALGTMRMLSMRVDAAFEAFDEAQARAPSDAADIELDGLLLCLAYGGEDACRRRMGATGVVLPDDERRALLLSGLARPTSWDTAYDVLRAALDRWPASLALYIEAAEALWTIGDMRSAMDAFADMATRHADHPCVHWNYAVAATLSGADDSGPRRTSNAASVSAADDPVLARLIHQGTAVFHGDGTAALAGVLSPSQRNARQEEATKHEITVGDILDWLFITEATGHLSILNRFGECILGFRRGRICSVRMPDGLGRCRAQVGDVAGMPSSEWSTLHHHDAVQSIVALAGEAGEFRFYARGLAAQSSRLNGIDTALLMACVRHAIATPGAA